MHAVCLYILLLGAGYKCSYLKCFVKNTLVSHVLGTLKPHSNGSLYTNTMIGSLIGGLLHLLQRGGVWVGCGSVQSHPDCTKCNSPPITGQCTNFIICTFYMKSWTSNFINWQSLDVSHLILIIVKSSFYKFTRKKIMNDARTLCFAKTHTQETSCFYSKRWLTNYISFFRFFPQQHCFGPLFWSQQRRTVYSWVSKLLELAPGAMMTSPVGDKVTSPEVLRPSANTVDDSTAGDTEPMSASNGFNA